MTEAERKKVKKEFLNLMADEKYGGNITRIVKLLEAGRTTLYRWKDEDKDFSDKWDDLATEQNEILADEAELSLRKSVLEGNITAIIFTLKKRRKELWGDKLELSGPKGGPIEAQVKYDLPDNVYEWLKGFARRKLLNEDKHTKKGNES